MFRGLRLNPTVLNTVYNPVDSQSSSQIHTDQHWYYNGILLVPNRKPAGSRVRWPYWLTRVNAQCNMRIARTELTEPEYRLLLHYAEKHGVMLKEAARLLVLSDKVDPKDRLFF